MRTLGTGRPRAPGEKHGPTRGHQVPRASHTSLAAVLRCSGLSGCWKAWPRNDETSPRAFPMGVKEKAPPRTEAATARSPVLVTDTGPPPATSRHPLPGDSAARALGRGLRRRARWPRQAGPTGPAVHAPPPSAASPGAAGTADPGPARQPDPRDPVHIKAGERCPHWPHHRNAGGEAAHHGAAEAGASRGLRGGRPWNGTPPHVLVAHLGVRKRARDALTR